MNRLPRGLAVLLGLGLLVGACGIKGSPRPPEPPPPPPAAEAPPPADPPRGPFEPAGPGSASDAGT
jgi:hypothetical protein